MGQIQGVAFRCPISLKWAVRPILLVKISRKPFIFGSTSAFAHLDLPLEKHIKVKISRGPDIERSRYRGVQKYTKYIAHNNNSVKWGVGVNNSVNPYGNVIYTVSDMKSYAIILIRWRKRYFVGG